MRYSFYWKHLDLASTKPEQASGSTSQISH